MFQAVFETYSKKNYLSFIWQHYVGATFPEAAGGVGTQRFHAADPWAALAGGIFLLSCTVQRSSSQRGLECAFTASWKTSLHSLGL